jgi:hypothetical protein
VDKKKQKKSISTNIMNSISSLQSSVYKDMKILEPKPPIASILIKETKKISTKNEIDDLRIRFKQRDFNSKFEESKKESPK